MDLRPPAVRTLLEELTQLPGVGPRTAARMAQYLLQQPAGGRRLAGAVEMALAKVRHCSRCWMLTEQELCALCGDPQRDRRQVCVVEDPFNAWSIEATGEFSGLYHVLMGSLDPLHGVGPDELTMDALLDRVRSGEGREVIVATNPTVEGEATAHFLVRLLRPLGVAVSRIAFGLPAGGEISYADTVTLARALSGRRGMD